MQKIMSKNFLKNITKPPKDPPGLIWVDRQMDVMRDMTCQAEGCGNPISYLSEYKCRKCGLSHFFKLKQ